MKNRKKPHRCCYVQKDSYKQLTNGKIYGIILEQFDETEPFQKNLKTNCLIFWNAIMRIAL